MCRAQDVPHPVVSKGVERSASGGNFIAMCQGEAISILEAPDNSLTVVSDANWPATQGWDVPGGGKFVPPQDEAHFVGVLVDPTRHQKRSLLTALARGAAHFNRPHRTHPAIRQQRNGRHQLTEGALVQGIGLPDT